MGTLQVLLVVFVLLACLGGAVLVVPHLLGKRLTHVNHVLAFGSTWLPSRFLAGGCGAPERQPCAPLPLVSYLEQLVAGL